MNDWLKIMSEAEEALAIFQYWSAPDGLQKLNELVAKYPRDGMVWFKRAQAYEWSGDPDKARRDYMRSNHLFPKRNWKSLAQKGAVRCESLPQLRGIPRELQALWIDFDGSPL